MKMTVLEVNLSQFAPPPPFWMRRAHQQRYSLASEKAEVASLAPSVLVNSVVDEGRPSRVQIALLLCSAPEEFSHHSRLVKWSGVMPEWSGCMIRAPVRRKARRRDVNQFSQQSSQSVSRMKQQSVVSISLTFEGEPSVFYTVYIPHSTTPA